MLGYTLGRRVVDVASEADVSRGSVNRWLQRYEADGPDGLLSRVPPGPKRRLTEEQQSELAALIEGGPQSAGYTSGVWTGPMIGDLIDERFGVRYHNHHVPRLLHDLGFSVQRPRKRLAKADVAAQARKQPHVDTFGQRKTAHVFGAVTLERLPRFHDLFASVFNGRTFHGFLKRLVRNSRRKIFLIIDNAPCHRLKPEGKLWLASNRQRIELFRLPPYSPNLNAIEGAWKETKKRTTHNRFFRTTDERDRALVTTFGDFNRNRSSLSGYVARFL